MLKMEVEKNDATIIAHGDAWTLMGELTNGAARLIVQLAELMETDPRELATMVAGTLPEAVELLAAMDNKTGKEAAANAV